MRTRSRLFPVVRLLAVLCLMLAGWGVPRPVQAATILVTTTAEAPGASGDCTLGEAIQAAQTNTAVDACPAGGDDDTIVLQPGATYTLTVGQDSPHGPSAFIITSKLTINGQGATLVRNPATPALRFFFVDSTAGLAADGDGDLTLIDLTLRGGLAHGPNGAAAESPDGAGEPGHPARGGAVFSEGTLVLDGVRFEANVAQGGHGGAGNGLGDGGNGGDAYGGAVSNFGSLTIVGAGAVFENNQVLGGPGGDGSPGGDGGEAYGAAIHNGSGILSAEAPTLFEHNLAQGGSGGDRATFLDAGGEGGDVFGGTLSNTASASLTGAVFRYNAALGGNGGEGFLGASGGGTLLGGLLYIAEDASRLSLAHSLIYSNTAQGGQGQFGATFYGGVLYQTHLSELYLHSVRVISNTAAGGDAEAGTLPGVGGTVYGALTINGGQAHIQQSALVGNVLLSGTSNMTTTSPASEGGGLYVLGAVVRLTNTTVAHNQAVASSALYSIRPITLTHVTVAHNTSTGGGPAVTINAGELWLYNSLVAYNAGSNCSSPDQSAGSANLQFPGNSCGGNVAVAEPMLGPLTDVGGTPHLPLLAGSPARDAAVGACPPVDQRDFPRPIGAACDLGAIEAWGALFLPFIKR